MISKDRLDGLLFAMLGDSKLVERWWNSPNKYFDGKFPIDVFVTQPDSVRDYIMQCTGQDYS